MAAKLSNEKSVCLFLFVCLFSKLRKETVRAKEKKINLSFDYEVVIKLVALKCIIFCVVTVFV